MDNALASGVDVLAHTIPAEGHYTADELSRMKHQGTALIPTLTTQPSTFFKQAAKGRVEKGMDADLVVLDADPARDVRNLAKVMYTIRGGKERVSTPVKACCNIRLQISYFAGAEDGRIGRSLL